MKIGVTKIAGEEDRYLAKDPEVLFLPPKRHQPAQDDHNDERGGDDTPRVRGNKAEVG